MTDMETNIHARLSAQRAFLGEISQEMRAAVLRVTSDTIDLRCYFDGPISERDLESTSCVEAEMSADFEPDISVRSTCIRLDFPELIPDDGTRIYSRRESEPVE